LGTWGTSKEHDEIMLRKHWEEDPIGCMKVSFPKLFVTISGLD
jgi:hypothetical protein